MTLSVAAAAQDQRPPLLTGTFGLHDDIAVYGIGAAWRLPWGEETLSRYGLEARFGFDALQWASRDRDSQPERYLWDFGFTPYLRWRPSDATWNRTFVDVGLGIQLLTHTSIGVTPDKSRYFGSAFQFGERIAGGFNFGPHDTWELAVLVQHVSNAGINKLNYGLTYVGLSLGVPMDFK